MFQRAEYIKWSWTALFCQKGNNWCNSYQRDALVRQRIITLALLYQCVCEFRGNNTCIIQNRTALDSQFKHLIWNSNVKKNLLLRYASAAHLFVDKHQFVYLFFLRPLAAAQHLKGTAESKQIWGRRGLKVSLISKCPYSVIVWTKIPTKKWKNQQNKGTLSLYLI